MINYPSAKNHVKYKQVQDMTFTRSFRNLNGAIKKYKGIEILHTQTHTPIYIKTTWDKGKEKHEGRH